MTKINTNQLRRYCVVGGMLLAFGFVSIWAVMPVDSASAQSQPEKIPAHFKSGSERSLSILREISSTLKQIDAKLQRMEKSSETTQQMDARLQRIEQVLLRAADRSSRAAAPRTEGGR